MTPSASCTALPAKAAGPGGRPEAGKAPGLRRTPARPARQWLCKRPGSLRTALHALCALTAAASALAVRRALGRPVGPFVRPDRRRRRPEQLLPRATARVEPVAAVT